MKLNAPLRAHQSEFQWLGCLLVLSEAQSWDHFQFNDFRRYHLKGSDHMLPLWCQTQHVANRQSRTDWTQKHSRLRAWNLQPDFSRLMLPVWGLSDEHKHRVDCPSRMLITPSQEHQSYRKWGWENCVMFTSWASRWVFTHLLFRNHFHTSKNVQLYLSSVSSRLWPTNERKHWKQRKKRNHQGEQPFEKS